MFFNTIRFEKKNNEFDICFQTIGGLALWFFCSLLHLFHFIIIFKDMHTNSFCFLLLLKKESDFKKKLWNKNNLYKCGGSIFIFADRNYWNSKYSVNRITCGTIIRRQICGTFTPPVRVSTCVTSTVCWTFPWTVCAKISFYTSYRINVQRHRKWYKISNPQRQIHKISHIGMFQLKITEYVLEKLNIRYFTRLRYSNVLFRVNS